MRISKVLAIGLVSLVAVPIAVLSSVIPSESRNFNHAEAAALSLPAAVTDVPSSIPAVPVIKASQGLSINGQTGEILYNKGVSQKIYPASTTKILTTLVAMEYGNMDQLITVGKEINLIKADSSKAGLYVGERIALKDLLRGLMLASGNDAANSIAVHIGRIASGNKALTIEKSIQHFTKLMNDKAGALGAKNSNFVNPHGYHNPNHYTTAIDMALIGKEAMASKLFRSIVTTKEYKVIRTVQGKKKVIHTWKNRNQLILSDSKNYYPYANGMKTGYTTPAGYCLVSSAYKDGSNIITVVMKSTKNEVWSDSRKLLQYGLDKKTYLDNKRKTSENPVGQ